MSQITLEFTDNEDLTLLLSFAKRLKANVVSVVSNDSKPTLTSRRALLQKAASDPLFLADIAEISHDFHHSDSETL